MEKKAPDTTQVVLMNFTHVYEQESFYKKEPHCWIDLTDLEGVNGYCDENAGNPGADCQAVSLWAAFY